MSWQTPGVSPADIIAPDEPGLACAGTSDVQFGQRVARIGMLVQHFGQSLVVGSFGVSSLRVMRFIALMTMKMHAATMTKSSTVLRNWPYLIATVSASVAPCQRYRELREIDAAEQHADGRHDDVVDQRRDDLAERRADDDADGHVDDVAAHGELFELFEHSHNTFLLSSVRMPG